MRLRQLYRPQLSCWAQQQIIGNLLSWILGPALQEEPIGSYLLQLPIRFAAQINYAAAAFKPIAAL